MMMPDDPHGNAFPPGTGPAMLTIADGGSLAALKKKGTLDAVDLLYNPGNYFSAVHILVLEKADLEVALANPTLHVHYLHHLPFGKIGLALSLPALIWQAARIIKRHRIALLRCRNAYLAGLIGIPAAKWKGIPTVVSLGGDNRIAQELLGYYYTGMRSLSFAIEEFSLRRADRVFCVNEFTRRYAVRLGVAEEKTRVIPHRIDVARFLDVDAGAARRELGWSRPTVLFVGRLERDKQVDVIVEAMPSVLARLPDVRFVFVGDGRLRAALEDRCAALGVADAAEFVGFQPKERIAKMMGAAAIACIPMSGFVIYEAAAAAKPIVAFDVEWHSEFIQPEVTGILLQNRDVRALAHALVRLLGDPAFAETLGRNARKKLQEELAPEVVVRKEIEAYREILPAETSG